MLTSWMRRYYWVVALVIAMAVSVGSAKAPVPDLNPAAISYKLPNQINWVHAANGSDSAVLAGDPAKPGMYIVLTRWTAHHMSHPHFHPNDRFITVVSGTWWVGTGTKYDPTAQSLCLRAAWSPILASRFTMTERRMRMLRL